MHVGDDADRLGPPLLQRVRVTGRAEAAGDVGDQVRELGQVHTVGAGVQPGGAGPRTDGRVLDADVPGGLAGLFGLGDLLGPILGSVLGGGKGGSNPIGDILGGLLGGKR